MNVVMNARISASCNLVADVRQHQIGHPPLTQYSRPQRNGAASMRAVAVPNLPPPVEGFQRSRMGKTSRITY